MSKAELGSMFLVRGESQPECLQPGVEAIIDVGHEVLCGLVVSRGEKNILFRPWGRHEIPLTVAHIVAAPVPDHTLADRSAAIERQRLGRSAAPYSLPEHTADPKPGRLAMRVNAELAAYRFD